jgi:hypothetical protein
MPGQCRARRDGQSQIGLIAVAFNRRKAHLYGIQMKAAALVSIFACICLSGCHTARNVVVSSYHAVTAPVTFVGRQVAKPWSKKSEARSQPSDVTMPGHEVATVPSPTPPPRRVSAEARPKTVPRITSNERSPAKAKPSPSPRAVSTQTEFPTAKAVPGKPGYVFSPFDPNGRYVDVSGYTPGSKVKDPWTSKIFIVP